MSLALNREPYFLSRSKGLRVFCLEAGVVLTKIDGCPQKLHQLIVLKLMSWVGTLLFWVLRLMQEESTAHWSCEKWQPIENQMGHFDPPASFRVKRSGYCWLFPFPLGGNGNNPIYSQFKHMNGAWDMFWIKSLGPKKIWITYIFWQFFREGWDGCVLCPPFLPIENGQMGLYQLLQIKYTGGQNVWVDRPFH